MSWKIDFIGNGEISQHTICEGIESCVESYDDDLTDITYLCCVNGAFSSPQQLLFPRLDSLVTDGASAHL